MHTEAILVLMKIATAAYAVSLTFNASPAINEGNFANYSCWTNSPGFGIIWFINDSNTGLFNNSDITVIGIGSSSSILTISGLLQYNNTDVKCQAADGNQSAISSTSMLKIQGVLSAVANLSCEHHSLCIQCNWTPPFSLTPDLIHYSVNVTKCGATNVGNDRYIAETTLKYCPTQYGQYNISVFAKNTVGPGSVTHKIVNVPKCNISQTHVKNETNNKGEWNITIFMNVSCFDATSDFEAFVYLDGNKIDQKNTSIVENLFAVTIHLEELSRKFLKLLVNLQYFHSKILINMLEPVTISSYGLLQAKVEVHNEMEEVCFNIAFFEGSSTNESLIEIKGAGEFYNSVIISRDNNTVCTKKLHSLFHNSSANNNYSFTIYDGGSRESKLKFDHCWKVLDIKLTSATSSPSQSQSSTSSTQSSLDNAGTRSSGGVLVMTVTAALAICACLLYLIQP